MAEVNIDELLKVYNSIATSRTRWVRNRNELRNRWKELFVALEQASGRDGTKVVLFDENWHEISEKGKTTGAVDRKAPLETVELTTVKEETPAEGDDAGSPEQSKAPETKQKTAKKKTAKKNK